MTRSTQAWFLTADRQCTELPLLRLPRLVQRMPRTEIWYTGTSVNKGSGERKLESSDPSRRVPRSGLAGPEDRPASAPQQPLAGPEDRPARWGCGASMSPTQVVLSFAFLSLRHLSHVRLRGPRQAAFAQSQSALARQKQQFLTWALGEAFFRGLECREYKAAIADT